MHKRHLLRLLGLLIVLVLALAACGGGDTPTPEPAPTDAPPTETPEPEPTEEPEPTVDPAELPVADLESTLEALEEELEYAHAREEGASSAGEESAAMFDIRRIEGEIEEVEGYIAAAGGAADDETGEDMTGEEGGEGTEDEAATEDEAPAAEDDEMSEAEDSDEESMAAALTLSGDFAEAREWTWDDMQDLDMITATIAGPREDDPETEYSGVGLVAFLEAAGVGEDATTLVATASDDYAAEIDLAAALECAECMIVQLEDGTLRLIMPEFPSNNWVSDVVTLAAQ